MRNFKVNKGWEGEVHLNLLSNAANTLYELEVIDKEVLDEIDKAVDEVRQSIDV